MKINVNDISFEVNAESNSMFWDYLNQGKWEPHTFKIIDYYVEPKSIVLDIGCWIGPLSLYMAAKDAAFFSIDPDPTAFKNFERNVGCNLSLSKHITSSNIAITQTNDEFQLYARCGYGNSSSSLLNRARDNSDYVKIKGLTFQEYLKTQKLSIVDFIKMDIEGGEFQIVDSFSDGLKKLGFPTLLLSLHYGYLNEWLYKSKVGNQFLSKGMMKIESILKFYIFKNQMLKKLYEIVALAKQFRFVYNEHGEPISSLNLNSTHLLKNKIDLLLSNKPFIA